MPLQLDILDVGQGDGMVVWLPNGKALMVDLGSTKNKGIVTEDSFKYFREHTAFQNKNAEVEWLILTHGDRDHYNMVPDFITRFQPNVRHVLHGGLESEYGGLIGALRSRQNPDGSSTTIHTGSHNGLFPLASKEQLGAEVMVMAIGVLAAGGEGAYQKNTRSVVLRIVHAGIGVMLTGDATKDTEGQLIGALLGAKKNPRDVLGANVLKIAHHGSRRTSNHAMWFAFVNPNYAFVSSDRSGALADDQKPTGHRLPQALTIDLLRTYATRLQKDCLNHSYVRSYQKSDYEEYNAAPDVRGQLLPIPTSPADNAWAEMWSTEGIFSTLARIGVSPDPEDPGAADIGVQYRVEIGDDGSLRILATEEFQQFEQAGQLPS